MKGGDARCNGQMFFREAGKTEEITEVLEYIALISFIMISSFTHGYIHPLRIHISYIVVQKAAQPTYETHRSECASMGFS